MVEKCTGWWRVLVQDMVIWGEGWSVGEDEKTIFFQFKLEFFWRPRSLSEGLRLPMKLDLRRTPHYKSVAMLATMSFCHPCKMFSTKGLLVAQKCVVIRAALHYGEEIHRSWILGELWNLIGREWHSCPVMVKTTNVSVRRGIMWGINVHSKHTGEVFSLMYTFKKAI